MNESKRDKIAARAYEIWEREGRPAHKQAEHWQRAEQEVARDEAARQMGDRSETAPAPDIDSRPAPPLEAAPPLAGADTAPEDVAQKRPLKKPTRSRRKPTDPQRD